MKFGDGEAGAERLDAHTAGGQLARQGFREGDDEGFGGAVQRVTQRQEAGDGSHVDDAAAAPGQHARQGGARQIHSGGNVHLDHGVDHGRLHLVEGAVGAKTGVVDQQVQGRHGGDVFFEQVDARFARQVGGDGGGGDGVAGLKLGSQGFQALGAAGAQHQVVSLGS